MRMIVTLTLALILIGQSGIAQETQTRQASAANKATSSDSNAEVTIDSFAWIAGHWQGEAMGGKFEETWNPPLGGTMMGMFKLANNDGVQFYELLHITKKGDTFVVQLKHFSDKLVGWEEKEKAVEFPLIKVDSKIAEFKGLKFVRVDREHMNILVNVGKGDKAKVVTFACTRAKGAGGSTKK